MRHEMFEYEGRISQLVRLVEVEVPQAIGVLNKILRNLEEYHAVKARDPRTAYDDVAMARAIWDDNGELKEGEPKDGQAASAAGDAPKVATNANSVEEGN
jgi:hypothetical protein